MKKLTTAQRAIAFVAIFLFLGIVVWWSWEKENESEEKVGIEVIEQEDGSRLVRNRESNISIVIDDGWEVPNEHMNDEEIIVRNIRENQNMETDFQDGVYLKTYVFENPELKDIRKWAVDEWGYQYNHLDIERINNFEVLITNDKVEFGVDDPVVYEDSQMIDFTYTKDMKTISFSCISKGPNYKNYTDECERVVRNNIK